MTGGKQRILIIDDEPSFTRLLKAVLEESGAYDVAQESVGTKGIDAVRAFQPDLILLDVVMPGISGKEIAAQLAADAELRHIPVVFLTASVPKDAPGARSPTIDGRPFLAKPVGHEELIACVERHIRRDAAGQPR